jgi:hypothetical protein
MEENGKSDADDTYEFLSLKKAADQIVKWTEKILSKHDMLTI